MVKQSDALFPALNALMKKAHVRQSDLALIAVDVGPGSFTGVRVGLSVARTMAQRLGIPLIGVSSLEAMAWNTGAAQRSGLVRPVLPATSGEFFFAVYRAMKPVVPPRWGSEKELADCRKKFPDAVETNGPPHPSAIAAIAAERFAENPRVSYFPYEKAAPLYLQPSWAERSKALV